MCQRRNSLDYFSVCGSQVSSRLRFGLSCVFVCDLDVWTTSHSKPRQLTFAIGRVHHNMQGAPGWHHHLCHLANESLSTHTQMGPESTGRSSFLLPSTEDMVSVRTLPPASDENPSAGHQRSPSLETCLLRAAFCRR